MQDLIETSFESFMQDHIVIKGARVHNLKNINIAIPRNQLIVITGPSGSGKSSLAFDTIYAEAQRRYMDALSHGAKQFLQQFQKPDADSIEGLSPSIAIEQKVASHSQRSTIGTITGLYDYLRVLYARIGVPHCYQCGSLFTTQGMDELIKGVVGLPDKSKVQILAPLVIDRKGEYKKELDEIRKKGFIRARIDGEIVDLTGDVELDRYKRHNIEVVIDRLIIKSDIEKRLVEALKLALKFSSFVVVNILETNQDIIFSKSLTCSRCGISYPEITAGFFSFNSPYGACPRCEGVGVDNDRSAPCAVCQGFRLRKEALSVRIGNLHIGQFCALSFKEAYAFVQSLRLSDRERQIAGRLLKALVEKTHFFNKIGVGYLTIDRVASGLSGGEIQRVRIAGQLGAALTGVLYVMDEPSIGLHSADCVSLVSCLSELRDMNNTVLIVEHDEDMIRQSDYVIDMGPGAGLGGGAVVGQGDVPTIMKIESSLTGAYLRHEQTIPLPEKRRTPTDFIIVKGASAYNLKNIDVPFPLGLFVCVTGVSGSGKSALVYDILYTALSNHLHGLKETPGAHHGIQGIDKIDKAVNISQTPLGRTPRSNPATYTGILTVIRTLFASLPESKLRGYGPGRFSFNIPGGRCEVCKGDGLIKVAMHFLPDVYVPCKTCNEMRFNKETLEIRYKGKTIADIFQMTVSEALDFFSPIPLLKTKLLTLEKVGLGYIKLGQSATTLSGGEAQRIKLARELTRKATGKTVYLLDEPTTGLHFDEIKKLLAILDELVDKGNTVIVIEHHLDVIKCADYIIDLGPGGGPEGGDLVATGAPEAISQNSASLTGRFLRKKLVAF